ncbi:MAG: dihydroorotase, partial [Gemmatimonadetes bacterium]|nr:dihydroorotase [Gemmatimonadota bacterium]
PGGTLARGSVADVVVFDPETRWTVDPARIRSRSRNSPWLGEELPGRVRWTLVGGRVVFEAASA